MMLRAVSLFLTLAAAIAAVVASPGARAVLRDARGREVGKATFRQVTGGVKMTVEVAGLAPGRHAVRVEALRACDPSDDPGGGRGPLASFDVGPDGTARATVTALGATLSGGPSPLFPGAVEALVVDRASGADGSGTVAACGLVERRR